MCMRGLPVTCLMKNALTNPVNGYQGIFLLLSLIWQFILFENYVNL